MHILGASEYLNRRENNFMPSPFYFPLHEHCCWAFELSLTISTPTAIDNNATIPNFDTIGEQQLQFTNEHLRYTIKSK